MLGYMVLCGMLIFDGIMRDVNFHGIIRDINFHGIIQDVSYGIMREVKVQLALCRMLVLALCGMLCYMALCSMILMALCGML